jgi:hypothetical protein
MNKLHLSLTALFCVSVMSFAQTKDPLPQVTPATPTNTSTTLENPPVGSDEWFRSGIWRQDHDLALLYTDLQISVQKSIPVDPSITEKTKALEEKRTAEIIAKAHEAGLTVDENGNMSGTNPDDKTTFNILLKPIDAEYNAEKNKLWESWGIEYNKRFTEAFIEAAKNLKNNAQKMK